jgi:acetyl esterase/lipase
MVRLREEGVALPAAAVLLSPWVDLALAGSSIRTRARVSPAGYREKLAEAAGLYLGGADLKEPLASPLYADLRDLPPTLVQVGDHELLLSDSTRLAEAAEAAGVAVTLEIWEEMWHVWHLSASQLPEGRRAIERAGIFVRQRLLPRPTAR